ncbi:AsmA family protein [Enterobacteriaceae bacterium H20N1]|uniref:AsmA family protein n=1 Tax=Dryocola boscaweniae TaxID=2925397 RepID=A0A9X2W4B1_9ENTR|nr:AsmA family protein [Dryocola boscaweniae]MCT4700785.1 AsmA family protein [Dryocola boscaweniae]MCT4718010.1 AsmA family protein [Dryocola boscaweniae]
MKFLGKLIAVMAAIVLVVLVAAYILLQTRWGAAQVSKWVNENSDYQFSFEEMDHRWASPAHVALNNVTFGRKGQPATLVAQSVDIGLSSRQFSQPLHVETILLNNGTLNLSPNAASFPFQADILQLNDMALNSPGAEWDLRAQRVTGGVKPWQPEKGKVLGSTADIQFSAGSLMLNGVPASNVLLQGAIDDDRVTLSNVGADIARGSLTGTANRNADGSWQIGSLRLNDIRLQTDKSISDFLAPITTIPSLKVDSLEITDARLEGKDWAVTDLDLSLRNLTLANGGWQSDDGRLSLNASEFINGVLHLNDPIVNIDFTRQAAVLRQFTSRWERGMIRASGQWISHDNQLALDEVVLAGLEYTLPENWKKRWLEPVPEWLNKVTIKKLSANRNLIIDIDPNFPFQLTALDGAGNNLEVVRDRQWGLWDGNISLNAAAATFNRVDVRRPSIALTANTNQISVTELSAFAGKGMLEATGAVSQSPQRNTAINLRARSVPINTLQQWGWPVLPLEGEGNLQLSVTGSLAAQTPLKPTVNGTLQATSADGKQLQQTMQKGEVPGA